MITVNVRKQGGAAIMPIPANLLKMLDIKAGSKLDLDIRAGTLIAKPTKKNSAFKRYTLAEILKGVSPKTMRALRAEIAWASEGKPIGREII